MNVFELFGKIAIDASGATSGIDKAVGHAEKAENKLSKVFKKIGTMAAAAFSVTAIVDFGKQCTEAYASIAAEESAFAQIMGDYADMAQAKLDAVSEATGITSTRMTGAMTSLTAKFKGLGYDTEDATTLASDGLLIAADAAAFWDMSLEESMAHLNSFINGSYEGGEAIGLFANDTQMAAYAIEKGIVADAKAWAKLDEATKQATRLSYAKEMQEQSGATGQAAKEADSYANVLANLKEHWRRFQGVVGKPILEKIVLPAMQKLEKIMPKLIEYLQVGIDWLTDGIDKVVSYFSDVFKDDVLDEDAMAKSFEKMFSDLWRELPGMLVNTGKAIRSGWSNFVWPAIRGLFKAVFGIEMPSWSEVEKTITEWLDSGIYQDIAEMCNGVLNLFGAPADVTAEEVKTVLGDWWEKTKPLVKEACTWPLGMFTKPTETIDRIQEVMSDWWSTAGGWVASACNWVLNLFGAPPLVDEETVSGILSGWWNKMIDTIQGVCQWYLKLFTHPIETLTEIKESILDWWDGVVSTVQGACEWVLNLFSPPIETLKQIKESILDWWDGVVSTVQGACTWVLNLFSPPEDSEGNSAVGIIETWWAGVVDDIQGVCAWVLNLFSPPKDSEENSAVGIVKTWWDGVVEDIQSACAWVLNLFSPPKDSDENSAVGIVKTWWDGVVEDIQGACAWVLNLFSPPKDSEENSAVGIIETWWAGVVEDIQGACKWVLNLFSPPEDTEGNSAVGIVKTWWDGVVDDIQGVCTWVLNLFSPPKDSEGNSAVGIIKTWWAGVVEDIQGACTWVLGLFNTPGADATTEAAKKIKAWFDDVVTAAGDVFNVTVSVIGGALSSARNTVTKWWNNVKRGLKLTVEAWIQPVYENVQNQTAYKDGNGGSSAGGTSPGTLGGGAQFDAYKTFLGDKIPGFATGLDYVPRDNYLARLHQGEAVLTRNEADVWRSGGNTSRMEATLAQVESLLREIAQNTGADRAMVLDTGAVVGQLAPALDARLGTISNRKGRRN